MNTPPEIERAIEEAANNYKEFNQQVLFIHASHFGISLMLRKVLEDLRSDDAIVFYAPKYADNPTKPFGPNRWADWLSERYTKKESVGE